jgi:hypothetical protein
MWLDRLRPSIGQPINQKLHLASRVKLCTGNQTGPKYLSFMHKWNTMHAYHVIKEIKD